MESCNSPHHYSVESPFVRIICINSGLSINMESQYSLCQLIWRVTTPPSLIMGSHCWQQGDIFKNYKGLLIPFKGQWSNKWTTHVQQSNAHQELFKIVKNMGCLRLKFWLLETVGRRFLNILSTNNYMNIRQNSILLLGMSIETRISRLMKKEE